MGVLASTTVDLDLEGEADHPLRASNMNELRNPAKPF